jgi:FKBP-type peptidyl-prolyl cis-trans isomerase SlyD
MKVSKHKVVRFHYSIKNSSGEILDSTFGEAPLEYVHGVDSIMEGLEKALDGKEVNSSFEVHIPSDEAYGPKEDELIFKVARSQFPPDVELEVGDIFNTSEQDYEVTIIEVNDDEIVIDANHPLAGEDLSFDINILNIRDANETEIKNGLLGFIDDEDYEDSCDCGDEDCDCDCGDEDCDCSDGGC